ncbi:helix-turn-helix domain-containing protein [Cellulomonas sp. ACRRI]|uniref:helix-turn-helix domain-containing protein n=1 Tax=Cellulomonas sp. ACRRI TaxID=2918188 RepID=UPI001EF3507C|nr:helix-turn-helix domain-containing protein [Cellulomonas sp. ACRRI]MCG7284939.1 helix-turn-helix domain-containing protein [Cellulomonas sp. ACRRI]
MADRLLTTKEVAELLAVTPSWLTSAAASGEVPAYRLAGGWRYDVIELGLWLTLRGNAAVEQPDNPRRRILPPPRPGRVNPPPEPIVDFQDAIPAERVAGELEVPIEAVRRWITEAILPGARAGRSWLVDATAFREWQAILSRRDFSAMPPGRNRTAAIRYCIVSNLLRRMGITYTVDSWQRQGGLLPTWAEAVVDPRRHDQAQ